MTALALTMRRAVGRIDTALALFVLIVLAIAVTAPAQVVPSLTFTLNALLHIAVYIIAAIVAAAYAEATGADHLIAKAFSGHMALMIPLAALTGALSPFCSCGVVPLIAALLAVGVPLAPVMAFWLSSPIMDPSMFFLTMGELGVDFAVGKTLAAFGLGIFGGLVTWTLSRTPLLAAPLRPDASNGGCAGSKIRNPKAVVWRFWEEPERTAKFLKQARKTTLFLGKWMALAYLVESLIVAYVPADTVAQVVGGKGLLDIAVAAAVGVPAYLNGYAAVPLVSGLFQSGMAPGAGMAFLVAGGVTSIPAAIAVFALVRWPVFALYLGYAAVGSIAAGLAYQSYMGM